MFKAKLFDAINAASRVIVNGYEIDAFSEGIHTYVLNCGVDQGFRVSDQEVEIDSDGEVTVEGQSQETSISDWGADELRFVLTVSRPLNAEDL